MAWEVVSSVICYLNRYETGEVQVSDIPDFEEAILTERIKLEFPDATVIMARDFSGIGTLYSIDGIGIYELFEIAYYEDGCINIVFDSSLYGLKKFECNYELV